MRVKPNPTGGLNANPDSDLSFNSLAIKSSCNMPWDSYEEDKYI